MFKKFDVALMIPGMPVDGQTLGTKPLGGSESAGLCMAQALAAHGARVNVFCNTSTSEIDSAGVAYSRLENWQTWTRTVPHDVCVAQRRLDAFGQRTSARLNVLWLHDMALARHRRTLAGVRWNIDVMFVLSEYMRQQHADAYGIGDDAFSITRNGVDIAQFRRVSSSSRDLKKLVFTSRPERGLDVLLRDIMPRLLQRDPEYRLFLAGYGNEQGEWRDFYAECSRNAAAFGDRVVNQGQLSKPELYRLYESAGLYVYPTPSPASPLFREVSCISAMEAQAAGLPIVTSNVGALGETIAAGAGILLESEPTDPGYADRFVEAVIGLTQDERAWQAASERGREHAERLSWSQVAGEWLAEFEHRIRATNRSAQRLVHHLWRTSDIVAAKHLMARLDVGAPGLPRDWDVISEVERARLSTKLEAWSFMDQPGGYRHQYEQIGSDQKDIRYDAEEELRFAHLSQWLEATGQSNARVLDYGCAHGAYAIALAQAHPGLQVHGVDIDRASVERARSAAQSLGVAARVTFSVWTHDAPEAPVPSDASRFDCALLQEVLEHVPEPWRVLEAVEAKVARGGKVYLTVPFGPWEFASYRESPYRCHIWHFDAHDLRDMLEHKSDLEINAVYATDLQTTGEPLGWWIASYTADHVPVAPINLDRHLWLQRPRGSVSAALILGAGAEETLHWALRSIQDVADEIVVADCGMSGEAQRIVAQYDARVVPGADPRVHGFDHARNMALAQCTGDWCLWIDADEKLIGGENLEKYLRSNHLQAYGIGQHHFACDEAAAVDFPNRLFRRRAEDGENLRFWGAIHEHPELGLNLGAGASIALRDVSIAHVGYLNEKSRRQRFLRNWPLLELDRRLYPERILQKFFIMRDNIHLVRYSLSSNGGAVTDSIAQRCRETIQLFRQHFLGKPGQEARAAIEYYSDALTVLGEGFEASYHVAADKHEVRQEARGKALRFASTEDFQIELNRLARERASELDHPTW